jgi:hypothetical protein
MRVDGGRLDAARDGRHNRPSQFSHLSDGDPHVMRFLGDRGIGVSHCGLKP